MLSISAFGHPTQTLFLKLECGLVGRAIFRIASNISSPDTDHHRHRAMLTAQQNSHPRYRRDYAQQQQRAGCPLLPEKQALIIQVGI